MTWPIVVGWSVLTLVLLWQLTRSRLPWRWRVLWLPALLALALAMQPPHQQQTQREVIVQTPGDAQSDAAAKAAAARLQQSPLMMATEPDLHSWQQLQRALAGNDGARLLLFGHGWTSPVWQALPRQTVIWTPAELPAWQLDYPRELQQGDALTLQLRAPEPAHSAALLDSRGVAVAETVLQEGAALLRYRPLTTGRFDWQLRLRRSDGELVRDVPLAFVVQPVARLSVQGEFGAPSFEQRALREWWLQTGVQGEFITRTGQQLQRRDRFNLAADAALSPDIFVRDLRSWLASSSREQQQLLQRVAEGRSLLLLSDGSESEARARRQLSDGLQLQWQSLSEAEQALTVADIALQRNSWLPRADDNWQVLHDLAVLQRHWQRGRIVWTGVGDNHRLWQRARLAYADWWQRSLPLASSSPVRWRLPSDSVIGQAAELCLDDAVSLAPSTSPLPQRLSLQVQRPDGQIDTVIVAPSAAPGRVCGLYRPAEAGWFRLRANFDDGPSLQSDWRVRDAASLPEQQWRDAQAATRLHAQTEAPPLPLRSQPLPVWPFVALAVLLLALLWWRERMAVVK